MASNQTSNQRRNSGTGQSPRSGQQPAATAAGQPRAPQSPTNPTTSGTDEAHRNWGSLEGVRDQAADYWTRGEDQMRELVREREATAVMIALAAGLGVGLVLGASLAPSPRPRSWRERMMAEGFGRRIMDRIESLIPEALAEHFGK
ncbi:MAG: hypothetical protein U0805_08530 [Pirellulales bacterium]